jgi:hypothetical protein
LFYDLLVTAGTGGLEHRRRSPILDGCERWERTMKAYLTITGTLFALLAALHGARLVFEWPGVIADPLSAAAVIGVGILAAVLSGWSFALLARN